jgi:hypothetical protein
LNSNRKSFPAMTCGGIIKNAGAETIGAILVTLNTSAARKANGFAETWPPRLRIFLPGRRNVIPARTGTQHEPTN